MKKANINAVKKYVNGMDKTRDKFCSKSFQWEDILWLLTNMKFRISEGTLEDIKKRGGSGTKKMYYLYEFIDFAIIYRGVDIGDKCCNLVQFLLHDGRYICFVGAFPTPGVNLNQLNIPYYSRTSASKEEIGHILYESSGHNIEVPDKYEWDACKSLYLRELLFEYYNSIHTFGYKEARRRVTKIQKMGRYYHCVFSYMKPSTTNLWLPNTIYC